MLSVETQYQTIFSLLKISYLVLKMHHKTINKHYYLTQVHVINMY